MGERFKCLDCPDAIGFDLCGSCHHSGRTQFGRFNQKHRAGKDAIDFAADAWPRQEVSG